MSFAGCFLYTGSMALHRGMRKKEKEEPAEVFCFCRFLNMHWNRESEKYNWK